MNIEELEYKTYRVETDNVPEYMKLSIEFTISVLEEFTTQYCECRRIDSNEAIEIKIQELKTYLDEKG